MELKLRVYQKTSQLANDTASSYDCWPGIKIQFKSEEWALVDPMTRTWELKLAHFPAASDVVFILVDLTKAGTVLSVVCVFLPVKLAAVGGPAAIGALVCDGPTLFVVV